MLKFNSFPKHHQRGKKAQRMGQMWENIFQDRARRQGLTCIKIENGCKNAGIKLVRVRQAFDYILSYKGNPACFIDTKTCNTANFTASMITPHQVKDLANLEADGHLAGYLVLFRKSNQVVFFHASKLKSLQSGQSLSPADGILIGSEADFKLHLIFQIDVAEPLASV